MGLLPALPWGAQRGGQGPPPFTGSSRGTRLGQAKDHRRTKHRPMEQDRYLQRQKTGQRTAQAHTTNTRNSTEVAHAARRQRRDTTRAAARTPSPSHSNGPKGEQPGTCHQGGPTWETATNRPSAQPLPQDTQGPQPPTQAAAHQPTCDHGSRGRCSSTSRWVRPLGHQRHRPNTDTADTRATTQPTPSATLPAPAPTKTTPQQPPPARQPSLRTNLAIRHRPLA